MDKAIKVADLQETIERDEAKSQFDKKITDDDILGVLKIGMRDAHFRAVGCMGWIWRKWLQGASKKEIASKVRLLVKRNLELRTHMRSYDESLPLHDVILLHCAIFALENDELKNVAEQVADASGDKGKTPYDNGELYAAAWCGIIKHSILEQNQKMLEQAALIWRAYHPPGFAAASKPLTTPWLNRDWEKFAKAQSKDFEKLWQRARKDGWTVPRETDAEVIVRTRRQIEHQWCWAHAGLAILAHKDGAQVITDPFWFPPSALTPNKPKACPPTTNNSQLGFDL